jgi:hypothetical protein
LRQAVQIAQALGIQNVTMPRGPTVGQNTLRVQVAHHILELLHALHIAGNPMPDGLVIDPTLFAGTSGRVGVYDPATRTIAINPDPVLWDQAFLDARLQDGTFSTADPRGTAYHEYSHFRVHDRSPVAYMTLHDPTGIFQGDVNALYPQVSNYSQGSALDFIGEVYAGLSTGRQFPQAATDAYSLMLRFAGFTAGAL